VIGWGDRHRVGRRVEQHGGDVDARDAVDERVVGLREERKAVLRESLDQPQLPKGPGPVERLGEHPPGQPLELILAAGARERRVTHVVGRLEVRIVDPHRAPLTQGDEPQALAVARDQVQPQRDLLDQVLVARGGSLEHGHAGHVHVRRVVLEVQERAVEPGEPISIGHAGDSCRLHAGVGARRFAGFTRGAGALGGFMQVGAHSRGPVVIWRELDPRPDGPNPGVTRLTLKNGGGCDDALVVIRPAESLLLGAGVNGGPTARRDSSVWPGRIGGPAHRRRSVVATDAATRTCGRADGREPVS
jgi:hypothetical protein